MLMVCHFLTVPQHLCGPYFAFPLDYMHLACIEVMCRLPLCWMKGPLVTRLPAKSVSQLSEKLVTLKTYIPQEFSRKPRPESEILRWKATELQQIMLYTGLLVFRGILSAQLYDNYLMLFVGIRILTST
jgi:hypothetical protein